LQPTISVAASLKGAEKAARPASEVEGKNFAAEGLRGLAALNVYFSHFFLAFFPLGFTNLLPGLQTSPAVDSTMERLLRLPFASLLWNGNFAVCVFFVLSGFVLSKPYYAGKRLEALRDRYLKRYLRLSIPIAASVLIGFAVMKLHLLHNLPASTISHSDWLKQQFAFAPSFSWAVRELVYRSIFLGEFDYNSPLWTMHVEFIGSLITFAFYTLMPVGVWRQALHYIIAIACICLFLPHDAVYYLAFLLGGLVWAIPKPRAAIAWTLLAVGLYFGAFQLGRPFTLWINALPNLEFYSSKNFYNVLGAFFLLWSMRGGLLDRFLACAPLRHLGRISFSLYLTHFFVLTTFSCWFFFAYSAHWTRGTVVAVDWLLSSILVLITAFVFERLVDRQGIKWSKRFVAGPASLERSI
jgi:peptidoglycan/LPS O-acetylase OafA/YrhL